MKCYITLLLLIPLIVSCKISEKNKDQLPSWKECTVKSNIINFVKNSSDSNSKNFIPRENRIAVFDNDGTLWVEQPFPTQVFFAIDRIKALANEKPEWKTQQPFKAVIEGDTSTMKTFGAKELMQIVTNAHAIEDVEKFDSIVNDWLKTARHPKFKKPYTELVYQPMLELLSYLRENGFKIYIVSGGSVEFMRAFAPQVYGIPKEQIIGTTLKTQEAVVNGKPVVQRLPELEFNDDHEGKVISIEKIIGKKPVMVVGNSDGDLEMMEYAFSSESPSFMMYINHTDGDREYLYDEHTVYGKLKNGWDIAQKNHWNMVDMKKDWKVIFPFEMLTPQNEK